MYRIVPSFERSPRGMAPVAEAEAVAAVVVVVVLGASIVVADPVVLAAVAMTEPANPVEVAGVQE